MLVLPATKVMIGEDAADDDRFAGRTSVRATSEADHRSICSASCCFRVVYLPHPGAAPVTVLAITDRLSPVRRQAPDVTILPAFSPPCFIITP